MGSSENRRQSHVKGRTHIEELEGRKGTRTLSFLDHMSVKMVHHEPSLEGLSYSSGHGGLCQESLTKHPQTARMLVPTFPTGTSMLLMAGYGQVAGLLRSVASLGTAIFCKMPMTMIYKQSSGSQTDQGLLVHQVLLQQHLGFHVRTSHSLSLPSPFTSPGHVCTPVSQVRRHTIVSHHKQPVS